MGREASHSSQRSQLGTLLGHTAPPSLVTAAQGRHRVVPIFWLRSRDADVGCACPPRGLGNGDLLGQGFVPRQVACSCAELGSTGAYLSRSTWCVWLQSRPWTVPSSQAVSRASCHREGNGLGCGSRAQGHWGWCPAQTSSANAHQVLCHHRPCSGPVAGKPRAGLTSSRPPGTHSGAYCPPKQGVDQRPRLPSHTLDPQEKRALSVMKKQ